MTYDQAVSLLALLGLEIYAQDARQIELREALETIWRQQERSNSLGKDQPQYAGDRGDRNSVQTCCDAADGGGCVDDQVDAASAAFRSSCVASHGTPDKSGRIDLLKERYVSRDGVHGSCGQRPLGSPNSGSPGA